MLWGGGVMLEWSNEFSVKNAYLDNQHKQLFQYVADAYNLTKNGAKNKESLLLLINKILEYSKEHFRDEESYMQRINYPLLKKHKESHQKMIATIHKIRANLGDSQKDSIEVYSFLKNWLLNHILQEDKKIEAYRSRLIDINEIPYTLEQQTQILAQTYNVQQEQQHIYICLCPLKEFEVCDTLHKSMQINQTLLRCKTCKQPLVFKDIKLDDEKHFDALAKKYFH